MEGQIKCPKCGKFYSVIRRRTARRKGKRVLRFEAWCTRCKSSFYKERRFKGKNGS